MVLSNGMTMKELIQRSETDVDNVINRYLHTAFNWKTSGGQYLYAMDATITHDEVPIIENKVEL